MRMSPSRLSTLSMPSGSPLPSPSSSSAAFAASAGDESSDEASIWSRLDAQKIVMAAAEHSLDRVRLRAEAYFRQQHGAGGASPAQSSTPPERSARDPKLDEIERLEQQERANQRLFFVRKLRQLECD